VHKYTRAFGGAPVQGTDRLMHICTSAPLPFLHFILFLPDHAVNPLRVRSGRTIPIPGNGGSRL